MIYHDDPGDMYQLETAASLRQSCGGQYTAVFKQFIGLAVKIVLCQEELSWRCGCRPWLQGNYMYIYM